MTIKHVLVTGLAAMTLNTQAARLDPADWTVTDLASGREVAVVVDNRIDTAWTSAGPQGPGVGLVLDLGKETVLHRLFLTPGASLSHYARSVKLTFTQAKDADAANQVVLTFQFPACVWWKVEESRQKLLEAGTGDFLPQNAVETSVKFNPVVARFVRIETVDSCGLPWSVAELELYGSSDKAAMEKKDAVVLATHAPPPLRVAAEELRYYIGELTGRPLPIIGPEQKEQYPGSLYCIEDLKPLAATYEEMEANRKTGKIPAATVNVERAGREVLFRAWPYANVLASVWMFLEEQGVRWLYPSAQGDYVPTGRGVSLDRLPLQYTPPEGVGYANFDAGRFGADPHSDAFMFWWRRHWTSQWGGQPPVLGGAEVPRKPGPTADEKRKALPDDFREGFDGYPHNFASVLPDRILKQHPDWYGMWAPENAPEGLPKQKLGIRLSPQDGGPATPCMSHPGLIQFIIDKALAWDGQASLLPMDAATYCLCPRCKELLSPFRNETLCFEWGNTPDISPVYYHLINEVAKGIEAKLGPGKGKVFALAYAGCHRPPDKIDRFPENVHVQVCQYGACNLPIDDATCEKNAEMKRRMESWARKCAHLSNYDYVLIHDEGSGWRMPVPLLTGMISRMQYLKQVGAFAGSTQASFSMQWSPWNYYAYSALMWNPDRAASIIDDFFTGYYREAATPMKAFYSAFEDHCLTTHASLNTSMYGYGPTDQACPPELLAALREHLKKARAAARSWTVAERIGDIEAGMDWIDRKMDRTMPPERVYPCYRVNSPIKIDGKIDEPAWRVLPEATGFSVPGLKLTCLVVRQTSFRLGWDDSNLYLAVRCAEPTPEKIPAATPNQVVYFQNSIETFFAPRLANPTPYVRLAVASGGATEGPDMFLGSMHNREAVKVAGCEVATSVGQDSWSFEAKIPLTLFQDKPRKGEHWLVNVCRNLRVNGDLYGEAYSSWTPLKTWGWHNYKAFNWVEFLEETPAPGQAEAMTRQRNAGFLAALPELRARHDQAQSILASCRNAPDLTKSNKYQGVRGNLDMNQPAWGTRWGEWAWEQPQTFDTVVIGNPGEWFALEVSEDGRQFRLVTEERNQSRDVAVLQFKPVSGKILRLSQYALERSDGMVRPISGMAVYSASRPAGK